MKIHLVGLSGNARHGKDTYAHLLMNNLRFYGTNYPRVFTLNYSFAWALKNTCTELLGWDETKRPDVYVTWSEDGKPQNVYLDKESAAFNAENIGGSISKQVGGRKVLQGVGVFGRQAGGENFWVDKCFEQIMDMHVPMVLDRYRFDLFVPVITDVRFVNEATNIVAFPHGTSELCKVVRPGGPFVSEEAANHISETEQNTEPFLELMHNTVHNDNDLEHLDDLAREHAHKIWRKHAEA